MKSMETKNEALKFAIKLLTLRKRSVFEIETRLQKKGYESDIITQIISDLNNYKYLNDGCQSSLLYPEKERGQPKRLDKPVLGPNGAGNPETEFNQPLWTAVFVSWVPAFLFPAGAGH